MSDSDEEDLGEMPAYGVDAIQESSGGAAGGVLPFNPRSRGPRDVIQDGRDWIYRWRLWMLGAVGIGMAAIYLLGLPSPSVPPWADVALVAGGIALALGYPIGKRVASLFSNPDFYVIDQLDAKTGDQLTLLLSPERFQDLVVVDHEGTERSSNYLSKKNWNGHSAWEVDRYYPSLNTAVASWQAGATNKELREWSRKVDRVKTDLEKEANKAIEAQVNSEEEARKQAAEVSNYVIAATEGVMTPGEGDLVDRLESMEERTEEQTHADLLEDIERDLIDEPTNGHGEEVVDVEDGHGPLDEARDRVDELVLSVSGDDGGSDD
jgi:hypothetical protein